MSDGVRIADLFAPDGGWRVRLIDLSGGSDDEDGLIEEIEGFRTVMEASAFARAYVRDSVELCRQPGMTADEAAASWSSFGEDARVVDAGEAGWRSEREIARFAREPAGPVERDWRVLDPRRDGDADDAPDRDDGADDSGEDDAAIPGDGA